MRQNPREARRWRKTKSQVLAMPIGDFIEDGGALKALVAAGITDVRDLMCRTEAEVRALPGMGGSTFAEIKLVLAEHMLHLKPARS